MDTKSAKSHQIIGEPKEALGSGTRSFFADVVEGTRDVPRFDLFEPSVRSDILQYTNPIFDRVGCGNFDRHIYCSIPTFFEMQRALAWSVCNTLEDVPHPSVVDLGASEGILCKAISLLSQGLVKTVAVDPNVSMKRAFEDGTQVSGASFKHAAVTHNPHAHLPFMNEDGTEVPYFEFDGKADFVVEIMLFQFMGKERRAYLEMIRNSLTSDGILIVCEKFSSTDIHYYATNEVLKNRFKQRYFSQSVLDKKHVDVISSGIAMENSQVDYREFEIMISEIFEVCACFWDAGNFKGYACSRTPQLMRKFINNMADLNSSFSTRQTPFILA